MSQWKSKNKVHWVTSLSLIYLALIIATVTILHHTQVIGWIYAILVIVWPLPVAWVYCRKCTCRLDCGHIILGLLTRLMPQKKCDKYTLTEIILMIIPVVAVFVIPQFWLWQEKFYFATFWILSGIAGIEVLFFVCQKCSNEHCPMNKKS